MVSHDRYINMVEIGFSIQGGGLSRGVGLLWWISLYHSPCLETTLITKLKMVFNRWSLMTGKLGW